MIDVMDLGNKEEKKKPIELIGFIDNDCEDIADCLEETDTLSKSFDNIRLISKGLFDVIACWNNANINNVVVFIGHWNDGVKE